MNSKSKANTVFKGAFFLTIAGLISKLLSAGYRVPLQNVAGDLGFYIYQQVYPFIGLAWMLSIYGFPVAISKLVAERVGKGRSLSFMYFYFPIFLLVMLYSFGFFVCFYFGASSLAAWMGDERLVLPLQVSAVTFLLIPFTSIVRGTFQGLHNMTPTALSQIVEQIVRVSLILLSVFYLINKGFSLYYIGAGAAFGSIVGAFVALLLLVAMWVRSQQPIVWFSGKDTSIEWTYLAKTIFIYGLFMCINYLMLLLLQMADAFTLVPHLQEYGYSVLEAKQWKGIYDRGLPLIQLGTVFGSSLSLALVPALTKVRLQSQMEEIIPHIKSAIKITFFLSVGASVGLIVVFPSVNVLFYENDLGTGALQLLSMVILFASLSMTISSMLQGIGKVKHTAVAILVGIVMKWILNSLLVPHFGINGAAEASLMSIAIVFIINFYILKKVFPKLNEVIPWKGTFISLFFMVILVILFQKSYPILFHLENRLDYLAFTLIAVLLGAVTYLLLLIRTHCFNKEELLELPFGTKLAALAYRRKENEQ